MSKLWGGRFGKEPDELLWAYNASIGFDQRLYAADIAGSMAYARALARAGVLTAAEADAIVDGLGIVLGEFDRGEFVLQPMDEDIHTAVERRLHELKGDVAGKLHTGRSRNDQVATDVRLYLLDRILSRRDGPPACLPGQDVTPEDAPPGRLYGNGGGLRDLVRDLQAAVVDRAEAHLDVIMPGYTHLQPAQPILFSHWLMSYFWMLERDVARLDDLAHRIAVMPLGSAALAGNTFGVDREALAEDLGFEEVSRNSLDGVADRDFIAEFLFWAALLQTHLSRLSEDLIIYASGEFRFVELDDAFSTGSSIMPQKKNPDPLELARGKTGRMLGHLVGLLTTLKGLPSAYDKDLQEDKEPLFDAIETLEIELPVLTGVVTTLTVNRERMAAALGDEMLATDLADFLTRRGVPFRESHGLVGRAVRRALALGCGLRDLPLEEYVAISPRFGAGADDEADVRDALDFERSVARHDVIGGTAPVAVREQIRRARAILGGCTV